MNHIDERRWLERPQDDLSDSEAEHLGSCLGCQANWEIALRIPALDRLQRESPPASLLPATLDGFDHARASRARTRSRALLAMCILSNLIGYGLLRGLLSTSGALPTLLAGAIGQVWTVLGVAARLLVDFPTFAAVSTAALTVSALVLATLWLRVWRSAASGWAAQ